MAQVKVYLDEVVLKPLKKKEREAASSSWGISEDDLIVTFGKKGQFNLTIDAVGDVILESVADGVLFEGSIFELAEDDEEPVKPTVPLIPATSGFITTEKGPNIYNDSEPAQGTATAFG